MILLLFLVVGSRGLLYGVVGPTGNDTLYHVVTLESSGEELMQMDRPGVHIPDLAGMFADPVGLELYLIGTRGDLYVFMRKTGEVREPCIPQPALSGGDYSFVDPFDRLIYRAVHNGTHIMVDAIDNRCVVLRSYEWAAEELSCSEDNCFSGFSAHSLRVHVVCCSSLFELDLLTGASAPGPHTAVAAIAHDVSSDAVFFAFQKEGSIEIITNLPDVPKAPWALEEDWRVHRGATGAMMAIVLQPSIEAAVPTYGVGFPVYNGDNVAVAFFPLDRSRGIHVFPISQEDADDRGPVTRLASMESQGSILVRSFVTWHKVTLVPPAITTALRTMPPGVLLTSVTTLVANANIEVDAMAIKSAYLRNMTYTYTLIHNGTAVEGAVSPHYCYVDYKTSPGQASCFSFVVPDGMFPGGVILEVELAVTSRMKSGLTGTTFTQSSFSTSNSYGIPNAASATSSDSSTSSTNTVFWAFMGLGVSFLVAALALLFMAKRKRDPRDDSPSSETSAAAVPLPHLTELALMLRQHCPCSACTPRQLQKGEKYVCHLCGNSLYSNIDSAASKVYRDHFCKITAKEFSQRRSCYAEVVKAEVLSRGPITPPRRGNFFSTVHSRGAIVLGRDTSMAEDIQSRYELWACTFSHCLLAVSPLPPSADTSLVASTVALWSEEYRDAAALFLLQSSREVRQTVVKASIHTSEACAARMSDVMDDVADYCSCHFCTPSRNISLYWCMCCLDHADESRWNVERHVAVDHLCLIDVKTGQPLIKRNYKGMHKKENLELLGPRSPLIQTISLTPPASSDRGSQVPRSPSLSPDHRASWPAESPFSGLEAVVPNGTPSGSPRRSELPLSPQLLGASFTQIAAANMSEYLDNNIRPLCHLYCAWQLEDPLALLQAAVTTPRWSATKSEQVIASILRSTAAPAARALIQQSAASVIPDTHTCGACGDFPSPRTLHPSEQQPPQKKAKVEPSNLSIVPDLQFQPAPPPRLPSPKRVSFLTASGGRTAPASATPAVLPPLPSTFTELSVDVQMVDFGLRWSDEYDGDLEANPLFGLDVYPPPPPPPLPPLCSD